LRAILDVDPGVDDALAILLALRSPELDVAGITTVAGNVVVEQGTRNALAIVEAAGAEVPVYRGADRPLQGRLTTATLFHGSDGLGDLGIRPVHATAEPKSAEDFLLEAVRSDEPTIVVALGPLTNLAHACRLDPTWPRRVHCIVAMCGAVRGPGNVTAVAEANCYADPEAAAIVFGSGAPIVMVPLEVTLRAALSRERFAETQQRSRHDPPARLALSLLNFYLSTASRLGSPEAALHDPLAVAVACVPDLVKTRRVRVDVELDGSLTRGQTVAWLSGRRELVRSEGDHDDVVGIEEVVGNVDVALEVDAEGFRGLFLERVLLSPRRGRAGAGV
jgi:purine nucleosidase